MKRSPMPPRRAPLRADPETTRAWQRRSQDAARTRERETPARRQPSDPVSDAVKAAVDRRSGARCEVRLDGCGDRYGYQRHHRLKREHGCHTVENLVGICANCHTGSPAAVHRNVAWAESVGLLLRSTDGPPAEEWSSDRLTG